MRTAAVITADDVNLAIDVGPDFRQQMLKAGITSLDGVLVTHEHNDHVAGLDDVRPFNFMLGRPMRLYAETEVNSTLQKRFDYIFSDKGYPGRPSVELVDVSPGKVFQVGALDILPIKISHGMSDVLAFRIGGLSYVTDAKRIDSQAADQIRDSQILVLNALRHRPHHSHLTLSEAIDLAMDLNAEQTYLTHISHQLGLHDEVSGSLPPGIHLAYDGLILTL